MTEQTPKAIIAGIMDRIVDRPGHNMLAHEVVKKLDAAGYVIVPKEATDKMICAALDQWDLGNRTYSDQWRAMLSAVGVSAQKEG